jgi:hypothetical protein
MHRLKETPRQKCGIRLYRLRSNVKFRCNGEYLFFGQFVLWSHVHFLLAGHVWIAQPRL